MLYLLSELFYTELEAYGFDNTELEYGFDNTTTDV